MKEIRVFESKKQVAELEQRSKILEGLVDTIPTLGGITYGSFAKGNAGPASDLDAVLVYKEHLVNGITFNELPKPKLPTKFKVKDPKHPLLYECSIDGVNYQFDVDFMPALKFSRKNGLLDSFKVHRVHDMMNFLYGKVLPKFNTGWIRTFQKYVRERFHWDEKALCNHAAGMCKSQRSKLSSEIKNERIGCVRALKLLTTGYYIAFNSLMMLKGRVWYQDIGEAVAAGIEYLGPHLDFFSNAIVALRERTIAKLEPFVDMEVFIRPANVLDVLHFELINTFVESLSLKERAENNDWLNSRIRMLYGV
jgi:hypothetical protein